MFKALTGLGLSMYEGDFGEQLPIDITEGEVLQGDELKFIIQDEKHRTIINKTLEVEDNSFVFSLTQAQSQKLKEGDYLWGLKQYRNNTLIDTLTANNVFKVVRGQ